MDGFNGFFGSINVDEREICERKELLLIMQVRAMFLSFRAEEDRVCVVLKIAERFSNHCTCGCSGTHCVFLL